MVGVAGTTGVAAKAAEVVTNATKIIDIKMLVNLRIVFIVYKLL